MDAVGPLFATTDETAVRRHVAKGADPQVVAARASLAAGEPDADVALKLTARAVLAGHLDDAFDKLLSNAVY